jgi:hypothetical protein
MDLRQRRSISSKVLPKTAGVKGLDIVVTFTRITGKVLPDKFWQFWNSWCIAHNDNDQTKMRELEAEAGSDLDQYIDWIEEIKKVLA